MAVADVFTSTVVTQRLHGHACGHRTVVTYCIYFISDVRCNFWMFLYETAFLEFWTCALKHLSSNNLRLVIEITSANQYQWFEIIDKHITGQRDI
jgi:hypothetical protein